MNTEMKIQKHMTISQKMGRPRPSFHSRRKRERDKCMRDVIIVLRKVVLLDEKSPWAMNGNALDRLQVATESEHTQDMTGYGMLAGLHKLYVMNT